MESNLHRNYFGREETVISQDSRKVKKIVAHTYK